MRLLLASKSAPRRRMLEAAGVAFEVVEAAFEEDSVKAVLRSEGSSPPDLAQALADRKALAVGADDALVLGADQTLELAGGGMLDKPASREDAAVQLRAISGATHRLHAAASIVDAGTVVWQDIESVGLTVRPLSDTFIERYLDAEYDAIRWGVGGYRIEGPGVQLFDRIEGSHFAILGLPLLPLLAYLRDRGLMAS